MSLDIAMCWDGETPAAELIIHGMVFTGDPPEVEAAFDALIELRDADARKQRRLDDLSRAFRKALEDR